VTPANSCAKTLVPLWVRWNPSATRRPDVMQTDPWLEIPKFCWRHQAHSKVFICCLFLHQAPSHAKVQSAKMLEPTKWKVMEEPNSRQQLPTTFLTFLALAVCLGNISSITLPRDVFSHTTLYFHTSSFLSCFKTAGLRALFHPSGSAPRQQDFAMRMDSELPTTSASSLSTRAYEESTPYRLAYNQMHSTPS